MTGWSGQINKYENINIISGEGLQASFILILYIYKFSETNNE